MKNNQAKRSRGDVDDSVVSPSIESDIKDILCTLSSKMDALGNTMSDVDKRLDVKIDNMETSLSTMIREVNDGMDKRLTTFAADIDQRFNDVVASINRKCEESLAKLSNDVKNRVDELRAVHEFRLDKLERLSLEKDLIITGVPVENDDNPIGIIGEICAALNCNLNQRDFSAVYRLKSNRTSTNAKQSVPIVAKLYDNWAKHELMSCYFKRMNLSLKDIGFKSTSRIFINENLTQSNREIFKLASEAKKAGHIVKFFTRNGLVHVLRSENAKPICIHHTGELEQMLPPSFERAISSYGNRFWSNNNRQSNVSGNMNHRTQINSPSVSIPVENKISATESAVNAPHEMVVAMSHSS